MSQSSIKKLTVVLIRGADTDAPGLADWFQHHASVQTVDSVDEALLFMKNHAVDLVIADADQFKDSGALEYHANYDASDDHLLKGICILDRDGQLAWANPACHDVPQQVRDQVLAFCRGAFPAIQSTDAESLAKKQTKRSFIDHEGESYEVNAAPIVNLASNESHVAAVVWSVTRTRQLQEHISAIDTAAQELIRLDSSDVARLNMQQRLDLLEQKLIRCTHDLLHFDNFTVHVLDPATNKLDLVLSGGMPGNVHEIPIYACEEGNGVCGWVAAKGKSYCCPDVSKDSRYISGIEEARSCLAVPLTLNEKVIGVFNVESNRLNAFTEDDRRFAESFARHIAVALHILNLLVTEQHSATDRLASGVMAEITAPLNDIVTEISSLVEDYIGHDELRQRLNQVSDNAVRIRDTLRQFTTQRPALTDRHKSQGPTKHDPVLEGRHILVADDEEVIRDTVCDVLRSYGCVIESAEDGAMAIDLISGNQFDLVLSDIKMPARDGYEVFAAAKERNKDCPVILMTGFGYDPNHSIVRARREGLAAVLFKPFKVEQLLGEIRTAIRATSSS